MSAKFSAPRNKQEKSEDFPELVCELGRTICSNPGPVSLRIPMPRALWTHVSIKMIPALNDLVDRHVAKAFALESLSQQTQQLYEYESSVGPVRMKIKVSYQDS